VNYLLYIDIVGHMEKQEIEMETEMETEMGKLRLKLA